MKFLSMIGALLLGLAVASGQEAAPKSDDAAEKVLLDNERALYAAQRSCEYAPRCPDWWFPAGGNPRGTA